MSSVDNFFSTNKVIFIVFAILILPLVLVWSLVYGVIIGVIGITVDRYEYIRDVIMRRTAIEYLKYREWRVKNWQEAYLKGVDRIEEIKADERAFAVGEKKVPSMGWMMWQEVLVFGIIFYPFMLVWGVITGPIRAFIEYYKWCYKTWYGYSIYKGGW